MIDFTPTRRTFLRVGALTLGGLTLPGLLQARARGAQTPEGRKKSVILVWLAGGPSHIDMYDLKPNAPTEVRGEFKPIPTNVPGIQISEQLPQQSKVMDKLAILRSAHVDGTALALAVAIAAGVAVAVLVLRTRGARLLVTYLAAANLAFLALFLGFSRTAELVTEHAVATVDLGARVPPLPAGRTGCFG